MVWGNKNCWKISFVVITFLDNTIFHPFTRTKMLFSSSLVNQAPSPLLIFLRFFLKFHVFRAFNPLPPLFPKCKRKELEVFIYGPLFKTNPWHNWRMDVPKFWKMALTVAVCMIIMFILRYCLRPTLSLYKTWKKVLTPPPPTAVKKYVWPPW